MNALQEFDPEEREEIVRHVLRTIVFMGQMMRMRAANEMTRSGSSEREPAELNESPVMPTEPK